MPTAQVEHVVQVAALVVVLKVDPGTQEVHPVFARAVQVADRRVPAAHAEQAEHTLFVDTVHAVD